jgi:hypothetical protein
MTQSTITNPERFNLIVNHATIIGFYTPFVHWAWQEIAKPIIKLAPIAFKQVIHEGRSLSSFLLPLGLITFLFLINIFYIFRLKKLGSDFWSLFKNELMNFKDAPIKNFFEFITLTAAVTIFFGSAFLVEKFFMLPYLSRYLSIFINALALR